MLYLGIGNAGTQILDHFRTQALDVAGLNDSAWGDSRLAVGDADTNNSIIYKYAHRSRPSIFDRLPNAGGVKKLPLDQFWSGGCGVYHLIGQLLAEEVQRRNGITGILDRWVPEPARNGVSLFLSAGGGTGGGAGPTIATTLGSYWRTSSVRIYTVLPAVDQFACDESAKPEERRMITCEDSFQCISAGRLLVKYLYDRSQGGVPFDLFLVSSGYLAAPPDNLSHKRAVARLDQFITRTALLVNDKFSAGGNLVVTGFGAGNLVEAGEVRAPNPVKLGRRLVLSALQPMDLAREEPAGLSALPLDRGRFEAEIRRFLRPEGDAPDTTSPLPQAVEALRQTAQVHAWLYHNPTATNAPASDSDFLKVFESAKESLKAVFAGVKVTSIPVTDLSPKRLPANSEFALLVLLVSPLVDDVYRLTSYYIQSGFEWQNGNIGDVAQMIDDALLDNDLNQLALEQRLTKADARPRLEEPGTEVYTPHFWGNYHHLKGKVLQALRRPKSDIERSLLGPKHIAAALWHLRQQLRLRNNSGRGTDAGPVV